ncbi:MAG: hypothetical protein J6B07_01445 [Opitutales bacterium]|nr:hypothetical protein [Opitutales bacterium]
MDWLPFYSDLKLGGHFACAFISAILVGTLLFAVLLRSKDMRMFERSYAYSLWTSALIWVVPMFFNVSNDIREILFYIAVFVSLLLLKFVFMLSLKKSIFLWIAFLGGHVLVFFMIYKKVF